MKIPNLKPVPRPKVFELGRVKLGTQIEHFLVRRNDGPKEWAVDEIGTRVSFAGIPGTEFFLHKAYIINGGYYGHRLTEIRTGMSVASDVCDTMALSAGKARLTHFISENGIDTFMTLVKGPKPVGSLRRGFDGTQHVDTPEPKPKLRIGSIKPPPAPAKPKLRIGSR